MSAEEVAGAPIAEKDAGMRLVQVTGKCPFCDVRKHQIDGTEARALAVVAAAIDRHIEDAHPDGQGGSDV